LCSSGLGCIVHGNIVTLATCADVPIHSTRALPQFTKVPEDIRGKRNENTASLWCHFVFVILEVITFKKRVVIIEDFNTSLRTLTLLLSREYL
jgi:hypothetical protein